MTKPTALIYFRAYFGQECKPIRPLLLISQVRAMCVLAKPHYDKNIEKI